MNAFFESKPGDLQYQRLLIDLETDHSCNSFDQYFLIFGHECWRLHRL